MANVLPAQKPPTVRRRCALGITREAFSGLVHIPLYRLVRIEQGRPATPDELQRIGSALRMLEEAHANVREALAADAA